MRALLLFAAIVASPALAEPSAELLGRLREGGYVLYLRHTSTDFSQNDSRMTSYADCASQRNLTDQGRDEARALGEHVKRLKIPVGEVLASPFCRTMETARLAFGKATATNDVRGGPVEASRYGALKKLLSSPVPKGTNLVISSHGNPFAALAGSPYLVEGELAVVRPEGNERFTVVARLRLDDWLRFESSTTPAYQRRLARFQRYSMAAKML
jgi:phosphohistidine phosphatase SixA